MPVAPGAPGSQLPSGVPGLGPAGGQMPLGQMPPGQMPPGQMPPGQMPPGQMPPGTGQMPSGQGPAGGQMPPSTMPPGTGADQSGYGQSGYQPSTQPQHVPADYQQHVPPGGYPATTYGSGMVAQNPAVTTQQQGNIGAPTGQHPPNSEYQTFNMQGTRCVILL